MENSKSTLSPFDTSNTASIATRWTKWKRSLELFLEVNCVALPSRKKSYLLHFGGTQIQDIFYDTPNHDAQPPAGSDVHTEAIKLLDAHFAPFSNIPYDRYVFRQIKQAEDETVEKFVSRLREQDVCAITGMLSICALLSRCSTTAYRMSCERSL